MAIVLYTTVDCILYVKRWVWALTVVCFSVTALCAKHIICNRILLVGIKPLQMSISEDYHNAASPLRCVWYGWDEVQPHLSFAVGSEPSETSCSLWHSQSCPGTRHHTPPPWPTQTIQHGLVEIWTDRFIPSVNKHISGSVQDVHYWVKRLKICNKKWANISCCHTFINFITNVSI